MRISTNRIRSILLGFVSLGLGAWSGCADEAGPPPSGGPPEVAVVTLAPEPVLLTTQLPGRTSAYLVAEIRPQVSGIIESRHFREGSFVKAGELLYQIDPVPYQAAVDRAEASLKAAEAELGTAETLLPALRLRAERLDSLVAIHAVGAQDHDDAAAALRQAEANVTARRASIEVARTALESARIDLSYTPIKAPISGRIGISNVTVGALATAYQPLPLAVVQQLDPIYVDVAQASSDLLRLRRRLARGHLKEDGALQRKVRLLLEDDTEYSLIGNLQFRDVTVDPTTGSVTLRIVFPNPNHVLLPGMFVRAVVQEGVVENALLVPQQAVTRDQKGNAIAWVVGSDDKVEQRALSIDRAVGNRWFVTAGVAAGDRLIVDGLQRIRPGVQVRVVPFQNSPQPDAESGEKPAMSTTPQNEADDV